MRAKRLILLSLFLLPLLFAAPRLSAHAGHDHGTGERTSQTRLSEAKKRVCENRTDTMESIMARSVKRAEGYGKFFAATSDRVKAFVENQEQAFDPKLIDAVNTAQTTFNTNLKTLKDKAVIHCDGDDPKGQIKAFQEAHRIVMQDLKTWRTALKDLIVPFKADRVTE